MTGLTDRQRQILRYLCCTLVEKQRTPTLRELMAFLGTTSTNGANEHIAALELKGYVLRERSKHHGLRVLRDEDGRLPVIEFRLGGAP